MIPLGDGGDFGVAAARAAVAAFREQLRPMIHGTATTQSDRPASQMRLNAAVMAQLMAELLHDAVNTNIRLATLEKRADF